MNRKAEASFSLGLYNRQMVFQKHLKKLSLVPLLILSLWSVGLAEDLSQWEPNVSFDGRVGAVWFTNDSAYPVTVKLWHPSNRQVHKAEKVGPGQTKCLMTNAGSDWGISTGGREASVRTLGGKVSTWEENAFRVTATGMF